MENIFLQFAVVLSLASLFGYLVMRLKLPLVVAYLLAGVCLSIVTVFDLHHTGIFSFLPEIGIAFVLFLIGMELDLREIKALGKPIILASLGQIILSSLAGFAIAGALGFNATESLFLGLGLSFSSTVVVIKMLLEKRDLTSLYGKLAIGILLLEDLVAIIVLMGISVGSSMFQLGFQNSLPFVTFGLKAVGLFFLTFFLSKYVLEKVFDAVAKSVELLFLTALTWCFIFTALAVVSGFSVVIGAFLAGVALASSPYHLQIQGKVKPLRDFFVTLFFVYLGTEAKVSDLIAHPTAIIILTIYAITVKPIIYLAILGIFGFRKHTMFQTSLNLSQVSEFSLVMLLVGFKAGLVSQSTLSVMAAVGVLSIVISSVMVSQSKRIFNFVKPLVKFFENKKTHFLEERIEEEMEDHIVVIGAHRVGEPVIKFLQKQKIPFIVVDFNPHTVELLREQGVHVIFGDISDPEILDSLKLEKAKLIISTIITMPDNEMLLEECKRRRVRAKIVVRATDAAHAHALRDLGADYVILPETVSSHFLVSQLKTHWPNVHFSGLE
jgi:Kef-type K+ transport system membrane component KefB